MLDKTKEVWYNLRVDISSSQITTKGEYNDFQRITLRLTVVNNMRSKNNRTPKQYLEDDYMCMGADFVTEMWLNGCNFQSYEENEHHILKIFTKQQKCQNEK